MEHTRALELVPDDELLRRLVTLLRESRHTEADLVGHVGEVDARRLYAREASPSMFAYCTEVLHLSEAEAYLRIAAARASREHPVLLTMLADGRLHLTAIAKLAPHLTAENRDVLLPRATHRTKRQVEELIAELAPRPDAPVLMRKLPERGTVASPPSAVLPPALRHGSDSADRPALELRPDVVAVPRAVGRTRPAVVEPLAPARYRVQFTASAELRDKLERLEARRFARTKAPRKTLSGSETSPRTRQIPAAVKQAVNERDGGRCRYVDGQGRRCTGSTTAAGPWPGIGARAHRLRAGPGKPEPERRPARSSAHERSPHVIDPNRQPVRRSGNC